MNGGVSMSYARIDWEQFNVVNNTIKEIDKQEKPMIVIFNKIDAFTFTPKEEDDLTPMRKENFSLDDLKSTWMAKMHNNCMFVSAKERINIVELKKLLYAKVKEIHVTRFPYNDFLFEQYTDLE